MLRVDAVSIMQVIDSSVNRSLYRVTYQSGTAKPYDPYDRTPWLPGFETLVKPFRFPSTPHEFKVTALRECPTPEKLSLCDTPDKAAAYWCLHMSQIRISIPTVNASLSCS
jgi:hypothetical protein